MATPVQFDEYGGYREGDWYYHPSYGWTYMGVPSPSGETPQLPTPEEVPNWTAYITSVMQTQGQHSPGGASWFEPLAQYTALGITAGAAGGAAGLLGPAGGAAAVPGEAAAGGAWGITDPAYAAYNAMPAAYSAPSSAAAYGITDPAYAAYNAVPASYAAPSSSAAYGITDPGYSAISAAPATGAAPSGATSAPTGASYGITDPSFNAYNAIPSAASSIDWGEAAGGLLGAGLGYLDSASMPDSMTVTQNIDPRLAEAAYGVGGVWPEAQSIYSSLQGQPNPMLQAGQQISSMANTLPNWEQLSKENQALWGNVNPWIEQQQKAITDLTTRNLMENIIPGIGTSANMAGGYGGSRQGIAQAKSISDMNTNLAPALTGLASSAYENAQNRALSGAQYAGSYGLQNQAQQAGLLGTGATMQMNAPWMNLNQYSNIMRGLPGNSSTTTPLFNNPWASAAGGASLGSQVGGSIDWGKLFGGLFA